MQVGIYRLSVLSGNHRQSHYLRFKHGLSIIKHFWELVVTQGRIDYLSQLPARCFKQLKYIQH
jgi:hypothetical protein